MVTKATEDNRESLIVFNLIKNGPYEFILDSINGKIIVMAIIEGGIIHEHGGIRPGDQIKSVNGIDFGGKSLDYAVDQLEQLMENDKTSMIKFNIVRNKNIIEAFSDVIYNKTIEEEDENVEVCALMYVKIKSSENKLNSETKSLDDSSNTQKKK